VGFAFALGGFVVAEAIVVAGEVVVSGGVGGGELRRVFVGGDRVGVPVEAVEGECAFEPGGGVGGAVEEREYFFGIE